MSLTFVRYPLLSCSFDIMMLYNQSYLSLLHLKGLYLIDRVPEELRTEGLWMEVPNIVQEAVIKTTPRKRNARRKNDCLVNALQIDEEKDLKKSGRQKRKGKIYPSERRIPKNSKDR